MLFSNSCWAALSLAGAALAAPSVPAPLNRRAVVPHDSLLPVQNRVQSGENGDAILRFNPSLHIASGCQVYTAADDEGNTSGGLNPTGSATGGCNDVTKGQTYARIGQFQNRTAIMYAWYWPKDQPVDEVSTGAHRHDWEALVVWMDSPTSTSLIGGGASGHGEFKIISGAMPGGDHPQVEYFSDFPTNHELQFTETVGSQLWLSDWDAMPDAERQALETTDFGSAIVPFKDSTFQGNLEKAAIP